MTPPFALVFLAGLAFAGCAADDTDGDEAIGDTTSQDIIGGQTASVYAEAALINTATFICSGSVIAPRVVLTAGHCVSGASRWTVTLPFAGGQRATGTHVWTEYDSQSEYVNPNTVDVGIIVLDTPLTLDKYPSLASRPVAEGTEVVNVGRIKDGHTSNTSLFYGPDVEVAAGARYGFPKSYVSKDVIQSGDSGGPVYVDDGRERTIVAVNSGAGQGTQTLARVDLVLEKIQQIIEQTGGGGSGERDPGTVTPPNRPTRPVPQCNGTPEGEPNDQPQDADALDVPRCGKLGRGDVDWFGWNVDSRGAYYDLKLDAGGDAEIRVWKGTSRGWAELRTTSPTTLTARSNGPGTYMVAVASRSGQSQPYSIRVGR